MSVKFFNCETNVSWKSGVGVLLFHCCSANMGCNTQMVVMGGRVAQRARVSTPLYPATNHESEWSVAHHWRHEYVHQEFLYERRGDIKPSACYKTVLVRNELQACKRSKEW